MNYVWKIEEFDHTPNRQFERETWSAEKKNDGQVLEENVDVFRDAEVWFENYIEKSNFITSQI